MRFILLAFALLTHASVYSQEPSHEDIIEIMEANSEIISAQREQVCTPTTLEFFEHGPYVSSGSGHYIQQLLSAGKLSPDQAEAMYQLVNSAIEIAVYTSCSHAVRSHWAKSTNPDGFEAYYDYVEGRMRSFLELPNSQAGGAYFPPSN